MERIANAALRTASLSFTRQSVRGSRRVEFWLPRRTISRDIRQVSNDVVSMCEKIFFPTSLHTMNNEETLSTFTRYVSEQFFWSSSASGLFFWWLRNCQNLVCHAHILMPWKNLPNIIFASFLYTRLKSRYFKIRSNYSYHVPDQSMKTQRH